MKMPPVSKPSAEQLARFTTSIRNAGPAGLSAHPLMQANAHVARWLYSLQDFLPPELEALGLLCHKVGRGHRYTYKQPLATAKPALLKAASNVPGQKRAYKAAVESRDFKWFAANVPSSDWINMADAIATIVYAAPEPLRDIDIYTALFESQAITHGSDITRANRFHPGRYHPTLLNLLGVRGVFLNSGRLGTL